MSSMEISQLEKIIKVDFKDQSLLLQSVVHRSYLNEHPEYTLEHNERLEFLGDAVLELVVTEYLYNTFKNPEGELTNWRASLVNAIIMAEIGDGLGIEKFIHMSKGEAKDAGSKARQYIVANAMEAIIGAIYLDQGYDVSKEFILREIVSKLAEILEKESHKDPKSRFQEASQEKEGITPSYKVLHESGPDHAKEFVVGVYLGKEQIATGTGTSKQEAQIAAAQKACEAKGW